MRILIYGINFTPELTGIGKYTGEMSTWLAERGHDVNVITGMPYYPEWQVHEKYKRRWWHKEVIDGVKVYRCPLYVPRKITSLKRILHEFSFIASVFPVWLMTLFQKKYDVVICISPPFHLGFWPLLYSKLRKVKMITHIQDLQVDAAKNLAMLKNGKLMNLMFGAEKFILRHCSAIFTISDGMLKKIKEKKLPKSKTVIFPNWVDENEIVPLPKKQSLRSEFGLSENDKVILYSGNLGEKQGLEIIIQVAQQFATRHDLHFLIVGNGGKREKLVRMSKENGLKNVHFHPLVESDKMSALLATADIHLVPQKKSASDLVMPSKITGILSAGGCAIVTASPGTSLYKLIENNHLGFTVQPESVTELTSCIEKALTYNLEKYKQNARHYAIAYLSRNWVMKNFERELYSIAAPKPRPILIYDPIMRKITKEETSVQTR